MSNNNIMIQELAYCVPMFAGAASQTRCFFHVVNLVTTSLIHQFDVKKRDADMALNIHVETGAYEEEDKDENITVDEDEEVAELDSPNGWIDELEHLSEEEREALEVDICPVKLALVKV